MRAILFKAKRVDTGEWVSGNVFIPDQMLAGVYICPETNIFDFAPGVNEDEVVDIKEEMKKGCTIGRFIEVDPETVCQFWRNHKGVNLWEGDMVLVNGRKRTGQYTTHIVFDGNQFKVSSNLTYMNDYATYLAIQEVTGNIHDK